MATNNQLKASHQEVDLFPAIINFMRQKLLLSLSEGKLQHEFSIVVRCLFFLFLRRPGEPGEFLKAILVSNEFPEELSMDIFKIQPLFLVFFVCTLPANHISSNTDISAHTG